MTTIETAQGLMEHLRRAEGPVGSDAALACELGVAETEVAEALIFLEANGLISITREVRCLVPRRAA